jgi:hypothetical protein
VTTGRRRRFARGQARRPRLDTFDRRRTDGRRGSANGLAPAAGSAVWPRRPLAARSLRPAARCWGCGCRWGGGSGDDGRGLGRRGRFGSRLGLRLLGLRRLCRAGRRPCRRGRWGSRRIGLRAGRIGRSRKPSRRKTSARTTPRKAAARSAARWTDLARIASLNETRFSRIGDDGGPGMSPDDARFGPCGISRRSFGPGRLRAGGDRHVEHEPHVVGPGGEKPGQFVARRFGGQPARFAGNRRRGRDHPQERPGPAIDRRLAPQGPGDVVQAVLGRRLGRKDQGQ